MLPLSKDVPKPLLEAGGKSLIQFQIENLAKHGIRDIVINHAYLGERIEQVLGSGQQFGVDLHYSREEEPLETAGGIIKALPLLGSGSFIVVNADIWTDYPFSQLPELTGHSHLAHLVMIRNADHHPRGDFYLSEQGLLNENSTSSSEALTYSGISVFHEDFFAGLEPGNRALAPLLKQAIARGQISGEHYRGKWVDVGTPERLQALDKELRNQS